MSIIHNRFDFKNISEFFHYADSLQDSASLQRLLDLTSNYTSDSNWILPQAYLLWRLSRYEDLLNLLNSLPSYFHADALFWLLRGLALKATRSEISEVLECYQFAYNIDNSRFDVCFNLANTLFEHDNKNPSCEPLYIRSLYLDPLNADCWYNYSKYL